MLIDFDLIVKLTFKLGILLALAAFVFQTLMPRLRQVALQPLRFKDVPAIRAFAAMQVALTALCYFSLLWWKRIRLGSHVPNPIYPYATPFIPYSARHDLFVYSNRMVALHSPRFFSAEFLIPWQYPPAMAFLYVPLLAHHRPKVTLLLFFGITVSLVLLMGFLLARRLMQEGFSALRAYGFVGGTLLLSYPFWTEYALGNMEIFGFLFVALGLACYFKRHLYWAAVLLGFAAAIKIFPFVYFALFLRKRQWKPILAGAAAVVVSNLAGLWLLCPDLGFAWRQVQLGIADNRAHYMLTLLWQETAIDHSGFGLVKRLFAHQYGYYHMPPVLLSRYMIVVALIGILSYFLRIQKMPVLNQIAALSVASILLPPTSHDYTLINLYVPWAMLVVFAAQQWRVPERTRGLTAAMLCFGILFASESELIHDHSNYSGQLKCLVLIVLFVIVLRFPWTWSEPGFESSGSLPAEA